MKKEPTSKNAAKWGTIQWIKTYRYSTMDRKRRRRAEKAVGPEVMAGLSEGPHTCCLGARLCEVVKKYKLTLGAKNAAKLNAALGTVSAFENAIYDEAFGLELKKAWGL